MPIPEAVERVRKHPGMYLSPVEFDVVAAFLQGCHVATHGGLMEGFREWLVIRLDDYSNLACELVLHLAFPIRSRRDNALLKMGASTRYQGSF